MLEAVRNDLVGARGGSVGEIVGVRCPCGFSDEGLFVGFGMNSPEGSSVQLGMCRSCREIRLVDVLDVDGDSFPCGICGGEARLYSSPGFRATLAPADSLRLEPLAPLVREIDAELNEIRPCGVRLRFEIEGKDPASIVGLSWPEQSQEPSAGLVEQFDIPVSPHVRAFVEVLLPDQVFPEERHLHTPASWSKLRALTPYPYLAEERPSLSGFSTWAAFEAGRYLRACQGTIEGLMVTGELKKKPTSLELKLEPLAGRGFSIRKDPHLYAGHLAWELYCTYRKSQFPVRTARGLAVRWIGEGGARPFVWAGEAVPVARCWPLDLQALPGGMIEVWFDAEPPAGRVSVIESRLPAIRDFVGAKMTAAPERWSTAGRDHFLRCPRCDRLTMRIEHAGGMWD